MAVEGLEAFVECRHIDSGTRCLVLHQDQKTGVRLPACIWCSKCKQWIKAEDWRD